MTAQLVLATHNRAKLAELRRILDAADLGEVVILSADDVALPEVEETGETFAANALLKARAASAATGMAALADDSGLVVDALGGEPGIRSARYAGAHGDDQANLQLVLDRLGDRPDRAARFVCAAALVTPAGDEDITEGTVEGTITTRPRGRNGFGYDPIFQPLGRQQTTAEMTADDKDAISHRGTAFRRIAPAVARWAAASGHPERGAGSG